MAVRRRRLAIGPTTDRHGIRQAKGTTLIDTVIRQLATPMMLGDTPIDRYSYYEEGDVLYLTAGPPQPAADDDESLEGDTVFFDDAGHIVGITMIGARAMLDRDGTLNVTLPHRGLAARFSREIVEPLLHETIRY
jgi:uncharacterized protein YuzE